MSEDASSKDAKESPAGALWRTFIDAVGPQLLPLAKYAGPALGLFVISTAHTCASKSETDKKVEDVAVEADATTKRAYKGLAKPAREISGELAAALARIDALEATQKAQSALIVARERDFVVEGRPATKAQRRRVDAGLVKAVKDNAARDSRELAVRRTKPPPAITQIPLDLPPAAKPPATPPSATETPPPKPPGT